jgi:hypothetical protein
MALRPTVPRLEAALSGEPASFPCPGCCQLIFAPGWWCDDCETCAFPTLLLDDDYEPDADFEPTGDDEPDNDYI